MGLFRKKINEPKAIKFYEQSYKDFLSEKESKRHKEQLDLLKENFTLFGYVGQGDFDECITAANLAWLDIAWSKYTFKRGVEILNSVDFKAKHIVPIEQKLGIDKFSSLREIFSDAFGSSYTDGNTAMAQAFMQHVLPIYDSAEELKPDELRETILFLSGQFVGTFDVSMNHIKSANILS
jgi:hypothetical protein